MSNQLEGDEVNDWVNSIIDGGKKGNKKQDDDHDIEVVVDVDVDIDEDEDDGDSDNETPLDTRFNVCEDIQKLNDSDYYRHIKIVPDSERRTSDIMSLGEFTEVKGIRAAQIEKTHHAYIPIGALTNPMDIAEEELLKKRCPLKLIRHISRHKVEIWRCNEMGLPASTRKKF
jgi:hypothetical protein